MNRLRSRVDIFNILLALTLSILGTTTLLGQNRDFRAERIVVDDNGDDGVVNTMTIQTPDSLAQNVILTIPYMGSDSAQFLLAPPGTPGSWLLNGNANTTPGTDFLGTSDAQALHLYVNGGNSNSLILNTNGSIQHGLGGDPRGSNATDLQISRTLVTEVASGRYATIGGGRNNSATNDDATVGGGEANAADGSASTVGGGSGNSASGAFSAVGGGVSNSASGNFSVVGGGLIDSATGESSVVGGGVGNMAAGDQSAIPGGSGLRLDGVADRSFGFLGGNRSGSRSMTISTPDIALFGNTDLWLANNDNAASQIRFYEAYNTAGPFPNGTNYTSFEAGAQTVDINYILPTAGPTTNGQVLSSTTAGTMSWVDLSSTSWSLTGNTGTTAGTNFLGTTDATALHLYVNGGSDNSLILNINGSVQRDTAGDARGTNAVDLQIGRDTSTQVASGEQSVIAGGESNSASALYAVVSGGQSNSAAGQNAVISGGIGNTASETNATISGGQWNVVSGRHSTVGGGLRDTASGRQATVGGGQTNVASNSFSTVGGGLSNVASGQYSTVAGGQRSIASGSSATVGGGVVNTASKFWSTVAGGSSNIASGDGAVVGGGLGNTASGTYAAVSGGSDNVAEGVASIVSGGRSDSASGDYSAIPGGRGLTLDASADGSFGFLGGNQSGVNEMTVSTPDIAVFGNTDLWLANNNNGASQIRFYEAYNTAGAFPNGTNYTSFEAGAQTVDVNYILPTAAPSANGQVLSSSTAGVMSWVDPSLTAWSLTGNAGTTPGTNFLGTTDATALHLYVNGGADNSLILNTNGSVQRDAAGDARGTDAVDLQIIRDTATQVASGQYSTVGGGRGNTASGARSTVSGGQTNIASGTHSTVSGGTGNTASAIRATVSGGASNAASETMSTVSGGWLNAASGPLSVIGGGQQNNASGVSATISGGFADTVAGDFSAIAGGRGLTLDASADGSFGFLGGNLGGSKNMTISTPDIVVFGNTDLWLANNNNGASRIRFYEAYNTAGPFPNGANYTSFEAGDQTEDINYILPTAAPSTNGQVLAVDTSGVMSWVDITADAWSLTGNSGTTPGTSYVGTSDAVALHLYVNGGSDNSLILNTNGGLQRDNAGNARGSSAVDFQIVRNSATQVASGAQSVVSGGEFNTASADHAIVSGGESNIASGVHSTVGGGLNDTASGVNSTVSGGELNAATGNFASVGGGADNKARGDNSTISGGLVNAAPADNATVGGRQQNVASGVHSTVGGGLNDTASGEKATVSGGESNTASALHSTVGGGWSNTASAVRATVSGGRLNTASGTHSAVGGGRSNSSSGNYATVSGGELNVGSAEYATIGGGVSNTASAVQATVSGGEANTASLDHATVGGGWRNSASGIRSTVAGGISDTASGAFATVSGGNSNSASAEGATVSGGESNTASGRFSTVGGGLLNTATAFRSTVNGGAQNVASDTYATVGGGVNDTASGFSSTIAGGYSNIAAGNYTAIAGGRGLTLDTLAERSFGFLGGNNNGTRDMTVSAPDIALFGNTDLWLANNDSGASQIRFYEAYNTAGAFPNGTNYTSFEAGAQAVDINYVLPTAAPTTNGQILSSDTGGVMSWVDPSSGTSGWGLTGNAGTTAGTNFIGTTDNTALHIRTNNADRLIFNTNGSIQRDAGGNARGTYAVDLQSDRFAATQVASGSQSTIGGGDDNTASASRSTVSGGGGNTASQTLSTVVGGGNNTASGILSIVGGGGNNLASGNQASVFGGLNDTASGQYATVIGGLNNIVAGDYSVISGGRGMTLNAAADNSFGFLGGNSNMTISTPDVAVFGNADLWLANNDNAARQIRFYEAYNTAGAFPAGTNYSSFQAGAQATDIEYILPAAAGTVGQQLTISAIAGTQVTLNWAAASDHAKKTNFQTLSGESILQKFRTFELGTWRYDPAIDPKGTRHYGIMAQDFHAAFGDDGLGEIGTDTTVTNLDLHGVSYLAIQGLEERTAEQGKEIKRLHNENEDLEAEVRRLRAELLELRRMLKE